MAELLNEQIFRYLSKNHLLFNTLLPRSCARRQRILDLLYSSTTANWRLMTLSQSKFCLNLKVIYDHTSLSLFLALSYTHTLKIFSI